MCGCSGQFEECIAPPFCFDQFIMQPRFHHILVPLETAVRSYSAVDVAFEMAVQNKASVSLLHVVQTIEAGPDGPDDETREFYSQVCQRAKSDLEQLSRRFEDASIECEFKVHVGDRLQEILSFAAKHQVDLIVMCSHRIDPEHIAETWGTLSYKVSVLCECAVLLLK
jgi:nucleotide-binding universal stress UspA family protein